MSEGTLQGVCTIPAAVSQPVQLATPATSMGILLYTPSTNSGPIYIGGDDVTASDGMPLAAGLYLGIDTGDVGAVYIAGTENDTVRWLLTGRTLPP